MQTVYLGGCWMTNMGNAFIDIGSLHTVQQYNCAFYSELSPFLLGPPGTSRRNNFLCTIGDLRPACVFFSGMVACDDFIHDQDIYFKMFDQLGIPVVFNGIGCCGYDSGERNRFRDFIRAHKFAGFISRDDKTYDALHDVFKLSFRGVDCAFFMPDTRNFGFLSGLPKKYTVFNIDEEASPPVPWKEIPEYCEAERDGSDVHCHHQMINTDLAVNPALTHWRSFPKTLFAEIPDEYIYLYGQSKMTFTTRVHASVATIAFGGKAWLFSGTPRAALFKCVGADTITTRPTAMNQDQAKQRKSEHLAGLAKIMESL